jgi:drug/metabolite transporter (DMT)-like permease
MTDTGARTIAAGVPDRTARLALAALFAGALGISFAPIFVRLSEAGPSATAFWRMTLALPLLWLWTGQAGSGDASGRQALSSRPETLRDRLALSGAGLFIACDLLLWHLSILKTSVANATLLGNLAPIFVALGSWLLFGQRFSPVFLAGLATAVCGAVVLMGASFTLDPANLAGDALGLGAALFYAGYLLSVGRLRARFTTSSVMIWTGLSAAPVLLAAALLAGETLAPATLSGWAVLLGLAFLAHAGGQGLITQAMAHLPAAFSSVALLLQPVGAAFLAFLLLGETLRPAQAAGAAIVLGGILLAHRGL